MKEFNINYSIKVNFTNEGIEMLKKNHMELQKQIPVIGDFKKPEVDENGYSEICFRELMHDFGKYLYNGGPNLLNANILVSDKNGENAEKFNMNENIKVKLTKTGINILKKQHNNLINQFPSLKEDFGEFKKPEVDENGYSEMCLHEFINIFGEYITPHYGKIPCDFNIIIPDSKINKSKSKTK